MKFFRNILKKLSKNKFIFWSHLDTIIKINDILLDQYIIGNIEDVEFDGKFSCVLSSNLCIYIPAIFYSEFMKMYFVDNVNKMVNLTMLANYKIKTNHICEVANKIVPAAVDIKEIDTYRINGINIYLIKRLELKQDETLFANFMNLEIVKERYKL